MPTMSTTPLKRRHSAIDTMDYSTVILDIEGTTTSITFVKDILFPFVSTHLESFLQSNWDSTTCQEAIQALKLQADKDIGEGVEGAIRISSLDDKQACVESLVKNVEWQMSIDRKMKPLKDLQGLVWLSAYENGDIQGHVYEDVVPALKRWINMGKRVYIYSSGSVNAQVLLFKYSNQGDLTHYVSGHFDTRIGMKIESKSYTDICHSIQQDPHSVLFLSDNIKEIQAATLAGCQGVIVSRPGNADITVSHSYPIIYSFDECFTRESSKNEQPVLKQGIKNTVEEEERELDSSVQVVDVTETDAVASTTSLYKIEAQE